MARVRRTMLLLVVGSMCLAARQAPAGEKPDASCTVKTFSYAQLCTQPMTLQGSPPALLDGGRRRQPCHEVIAGDASLAKLEVTVDRQGRLVRAKLVDPSGPCATKCLERTFGLTFLPASVGGIPTMQNTTVVCRAAPAKEGASGRTSGCS